MRRDRAADNGPNEYLIVKLIEGAPALGVTRVSLNFAVFREAIERGERIGAGPLLRAWRGLLIFASRWCRSNRCTGSTSSSDPIGNPGSCRMSPAATSRGSFSPPSKRRSPARRSSNACCAARPQSPRDLENDDRARKGAGSPRVSQRSRRRQPTLRTHALAESLTVQSARTSVGSCLAAEPLAPRRCHRDDVRAELAGDRPARLVR
ncbi:MAG: lysyl-tRNA synthetase, class [Pseudonocardiales bacterium]|nr:lysyl-tRNA synthetase, class [Pseudonocardiales bacterium]